MLKGTPGHNFKAQHRELVAVCLSLKTVQVVPLDCFTVLWECFPVIFLHIQPQ